jgi:hypothetical protein
MGTCFDINFDWLLGGLHLYGHCLCENVIADEVRQRRIVIYIYKLVVEDSAVINGCLDFCGENIVCGTYRYYPVTAGSRPVKRFGTVRSGGKYCNPPKL